ncbi:branched-chain amino acid ABC transporter permease [Variovorax sp. PBL-E5]|uniref:branched-chain amino acid ABC transporter permease n=1 Tax=Variovorax sp. PBL-E5 TaxID=434014 RepID=UPI001318ACB0|nr:branched-chain amino acid ABC transporter permease [Variovorax sp. PBL-E5]VTU45240.1 leucine/isoleucine/valine transporter permease subunit [Variovorax sp. PBL-E5]
MFPVPTFFERHRLLLLGGGAIVLLAAPWVAYPIFLMKLMCFALLAASLNLMVGYVGLLSFGHAMFFGAAGYATAHAVKVWGFDPALGVLFGAAVAAAIGALTGVLAIRRAGIAFSMITLACAQLVYFIALRSPFTGGEDGIQNVPRGSLFGLLKLDDNLTLYYVVMVAVVAAFWLIWRVVYSPFGQVLTAIRDNEPRAISLGYRVNRYKLLAFTLSAALAGLAGGIKSIVFQIATLTDVSWVTSGEALLMGIVGGLQTLLGPVVGALVVVSMENALSGFAEVVLIVQGVVFVLVVMLFRRGIVGEINAKFKRPPLSPSAPAPEVGGRGPADAAAHPFS